MVACLIILLVYYLKIGKNKNPWLDGKSNQIHLLMAINAEIFLHPSWYTTKLYFKNIKIHHWFGYLRRKIPWLICGKKFKIDSLEVFPQRRWNIFKSSYIISSLSTECMMLNATWRHPNTILLLPRVHKNIMTAYRLFESGQLGNREIRFPPRD